MAHKADGDYRKTLDQIAATVVDSALLGESQGWREIGDRMDGKPAQAVSLGNEDGKPFEITEIVRSIVRPANPNG